MPEYDKPASHPILAMRPPGIEYAWLTPTAWRSAGDLHRMSPPSRQTDNPCLYRAYLDINFNLQAWVVILDFFGIGSGDTLISVKGLAWAKLRHPIAGFWQMHLSLLQVSLPVHLMPFRVSADNTEEGEGFLNKT